MDEWSTAGVLVRGVQETMVWQMLSVRPKSDKFTWEEEAEACLGEGQGKEGIRPWQAF